MVKFRHAGIVVSDAERSLEFYNYLLKPVSVKDMVEEGEYIDTFLGLSSVKVRTIKMTLMCGSIVELLCFYSHEDVLDREKLITNIGCSHVALTVDNLSDTYIRLLAIGTPFINKPHLSLDGKAKVAFCKDPDGTFLELVEEIK